MLSMAALTFVCLLCTAIKHPFFRRQIRAVRVCDYAGRLTDLAVQSSQCFLISLCHDVSCMTRVVSFS